MAGGHTTGSDSPARRGPSGSMGGMSLLAAPSAPTSGPRRAFILLLVAATALGAGYFLLTRSAAPPERAGSAGAGPAARAPTPAPADPAPDPVVAPASPPAAAAAPAAVRPAVEPRLRVTSDVVGADVFIDRQYAGKTPFESYEVAPGSHRIDVSVPGYDSFSRDVTIDDDVTHLDAVFRVLVLDQQVPVVHKHRFGDCEGVLMADLNGIHYRTGDDHAFSVQFDALAEFSVDYLEHNLRLRVQGGRTYNFTDGEANADQLFVFHREVEKVRTKLANPER